MEDMQDKLWVIFQKVCKVSSFYLYYLQNDSSSNNACGGKELNQTTLACQAALACFASQTIQ